MHILETYALLTGCKIDRPFTYEEHIELPSNKYITFHPYSPKGSSKQYKYWNEVIQLLKNNAKFNFDIIQIGGADDLKYDVDTSYLGRTTYHSLAYLIKHSSLHLGFDSLPVHLASYYDKKIVALYSYYASTCGPYFSSLKNIRVLEPDFNKAKPVFNYDDPLGLINTIDYYKIYRAITELLELE